VLILTCDIFHGIFRRISHQPDIALCEKSLIENGGSEELGDDVYKFLKHWLADHILEEDMRYEPSLVGA
jgi:hemerythrin